MHDRMQVNVVNTLVVVDNNQCWEWLPFGPTSKKMKHCCHNVLSIHKQTHKQLYVSDNVVGKRLHIEELHCEGAILLACVSGGRPVRLTLDLVTLHNVNDHHNHLALLLPHQVPEVSESAGQWPLSGNELVRVIVSLYVQTVKTTLHICLLDSIP